MRNTGLVTALVAVAIAVATDCGHAAGPDGSGPAPAPDIVAQNLKVPWGVAFLPDGAALVAQRGTGEILRVVAGSPPQRVHQVSGVVARGEGGLLGLAVSPQYAQNGYVYAYFTAANDNRIVRFKLGGQAEVIFSGLAKNSIHNGGRIAFGPDGMLYVGTGDAGQSNRAQDPASPNGKILRLTPEGKPAPGNPNPNSPVYTLGHRNVQGLAWDSAGRMYATEFGQDTYDEVNRIEAGRNYGWPVVEGKGDTQGGRYTNPLITWTTDEASPSGLAIAGNTLYVAALRGERLWTIPERADGTLGTPQSQLDTYGRLRTVAVAPDGSLWVTTSNTDGRGEPLRNDDHIYRIPAR
ncbi:PQQ-dependent sugar dehydrogenase [Nocardia pseudobrasiliensis]|uniref:Glucose/arabinose dehydrogenase n=1 Tax=Nocardia pseudobrasiliensis TaxID=45979 RepID=A0A370HQY1_9NOCA|nr:PQQ-dependent sugar dehydrogenase [Nocardia pseudobrasiliensis]RDI60371.1 glucose/arabinose dehydrogenase [Nocardia pseudobrasiliensis]